MKLPKIIIKVIENRNCKKINIYRKGQKYGILFRDGYNYEFRAKDFKFTGNYLMNMEHWLIEHNWKLV